MHNKKATAVMRKFIMAPLCVILCAAGLLTAGIRVSIIVDDNYGFAVNEAATEALQGDLQVEMACEIRTFTFSRYQDSDPSFVARSDLLFVYMHNPKVFEQAKPQIVEALRRGARVYALDVTVAEEEYKKLGVRFDPEVLRYFEHKGKENIANMLLCRLNRDFSVDCNFRKVHPYPESGIYDYENDTIYAGREDFIARYKAYKEGNPWIGVVFGIHDLLMGQREYVIDHIRSIEREGFNVLPVYGSPAHVTAENVFIDTAGKPVVRGIIALFLWHGVRSDLLEKVFNRIGVPVINCIQLSGQRKEWERSPQGISVFNRASFLAIPEISGQIQPTVTASREEVAVGGDVYKRKTVIAAQVRKAVDRIKNWYLLQVKPDGEKKVAIIYYSYPPGKDNIGASYLNVMPQSIVTILERMKDDGYTLGETAVNADTVYRTIMAHGRNVGNWAPAEVAATVKTGGPVLVPVKLYHEWYQKLSPLFRAAVEKKWGTPEECTIMTWTDRNGGKYFVLPAVKYGNTLLTPQPARGWGQDVTKMYHDVTLPPHHQYIAFYLYLKYGFQADALIHLGTHGTHEWLSGKEAGLNDDDPPEALIADMVNIYPYIVDDVGEGLQAKRRGMAVIVDHMTPPFDKAGANPEMKELAGLISDYGAAQGKSPVLADSKLAAIRKAAESLGLLKDLGLQSLENDDDIQHVEHYIKEIAEKQTPFGLHTFGRSPDSCYAASTAAAIAARRKGLSAKEREMFIREMTSRITASAPRELGSLMNALDGKFIPAGTGNDPLRNPASLPTGKNFYSFDPSRIPAKETYGTGCKLAEELIDGYRKKHDGRYPDKIAVNLWSTECIRHEGIMESQILSLLGVTPVWDTYGKVKGVEPVPSPLLKRPRIDVVMVPSGLYRDVFPHLMLLLDSAVQLVKRIDEADNYVRQHILAARKILMDEGVADTLLAEKLASVRMFSVPPGAYGAGIADITEASGTWDNERQVADVWFNRMGHLYGQGFWGEKPEEADPSLPRDFSISLFRKTLSGTRAVVHSRSSNVFAALDNDDFFQYLGGTAMAVRAVDGKTPEVMVTNLSDPSSMGQETLDKFIGREMKTRYLNPKWIGEMLDEGYAGARFVNKVVTNLWGWQVTVPEAVDENKWRQMYETYVEDKYDLDIREKFREAGNLYAYQGVLARMLETIRKDYWHPGEATVNRLLKEFSETVKEVGLSCSGTVCDNAPLSEYIGKKLVDVPGVTKKDVNRLRKSLKAVKEVKRREQTAPDPEQTAKNEPSNKEKYMPDAKPRQTVKGYEMREVVSKAREIVEKRPVKIGLVIVIVIFAAAFLKGRSRKDRF